MVDSPHDHAEQGVAGAEQLHFLGDEVLLLGLRLARNGRGDAGCRSHVQGEVVAGSLRSAAWKSKRLSSTPPAPSP